MLPFTLQDIQNIKSSIPTPFVIYNEKGIIDNMNYFNQSFSILPGFKNYFAVKATPNPSIMQILKTLNSGMDCSALGELTLAEKLGFSGENIMFTSNNTPAHEFVKAQELGAIINFDDITHIPFFTEHVKQIPHIACCRYNPGPLKSGNAIIGEPQEAKYGMTQNQIIQSYKMLKELGVPKLGLHTMIASNELDIRYFIDTAKMIFELAVQIEKETGITLDFINLGGGIGIPYKPDQKPIDLEKLAKGILEQYNKIIGTSRPQPINIITECGRMITGPYGYLITQAIHTKNTYKNYIGVDACMSSLMRPGMYGAYHHITVLGKENISNTNTYDIVGSLCENNDKFAINRPLPEIELGDIIAIHDAGAHGTAMGFNYNAQLRPAEVLLHSDGSHTLIRRSETLNDYFATIDGVNGFDIF